MTSLLHNLTQIFQTGIRKLKKKTQNLQTQEMQYCNHHGLVQTKLVLI